MAVVIHRPWTRQGGKRRVLTILVSQEPCGMGIMGQILQLKDRKFQEMRSFALVSGQRESQGTASALRSSDAGAKVGTSSGSPSCRTRTGDPASHASLTAAFFLLPVWKEGRERGSWRLQTHLPCESLESERPWPRASTLREQVGRQDAMVGTLRAAQF